MLIGIDGNEANEVRADIGAPAGVNVYAFELLKAIYKLQDEWKDRHRVVVHLKSPPSKLLPKPTPAFSYKVLPGEGFGSSHVLHLICFLKNLMVELQVSCLALVITVRSLFPYPKLSQLWTSATSIIRLL